MIVIPLAGMSRRFTEAGYDQPKYMLPLHGRSVFAHAVASFAACFGQEEFLFVARDIAGTAGFIAAECATLGLRDPRLTLLPGATAGQAETVEFGLRRQAVPEATPLTIFNIDTFRPGFRFPTAAWRARSDGYLEVFRGSGANWSYVRPGPGPEPVVLETAEKRPLSDLCCTGLYHFARTGDFHAALRQERQAPSAPELYVAPLYNHLIRRGAAIHYQRIAAEEVLFCGVPAEYRALQAAPSIPGPAASV